ncbi:MAG: HAMP domain-containing protein [Actinobacteria bacterium]|nr:HAMP domain-containing protein [Actinomycetota bacterium]
MSTVGVASGEGGLDRTGHGVDTHGIDTHGVDTDGAVRAAADSVRAAADSVRAGDDSARVADGAVPPPSSPLMSSTPLARILRRFERFGPRRLFGSVRVRLTFAVSMIFAGALVLASIGMVRQIEAALVNDVHDRSDTLARTLGQMVANGQINALTAQDISQLTSGLSNSIDQELLQEGLSNSFVYVRGAGASQVSQGTSILDRIKQAVTDEEIPLMGKVLPTRIDEDQYVVSQVSVDTELGNVVLSVASPLAQVKRTVDEVRGALSFAVPSLVGAVAIMAWMMTGRALRPVQAITNRAREISATTLDQRVPVPQTDDEIGQLACTMNAMLNRLEDASESQKRFISDASHELRSPVASIRLQLETALMRPESTDWEAVGRTVLAEDQRLSSLVDNLLALARLEEGQRRHHSEVDVDELIHDQLARPRRVPIDRSGVLAGRVYGVRDELMSVVRNLIDNGERHAQSRMRVSLVTRGPWVRIAVEDDGPGVAIELREKVFERFARLEEARSRDAGGAGIGLALTKRIVETHNGHIFITDSDLGGAAFIVELPSADLDLDFDT